MNKWPAAVLAVLLAGAGLVFLATTRQHASPDRVAAVLRDSPDAAGFEKVLGPRPFEFPLDHGAHPAFRHEWWYVTGHLAGSDGKRHGFQLTFFRYALAPGDTPSVSQWRSRQVLLGHLAVTDIDGQRFETHARQARAALGLAGAEVGTAKVWIRDWTLDLDPASSDWRIRAAVDGLALELVLHAELPVALQGDAGYSRKSTAVGNASHYYSLPRLSVRGTLRHAGSDEQVQGSAWLDHEWGSSGLGAEQQGWDWFALHLDDGRALSFYRLRQADGSMDPTSLGIVVTAGGETRALAPDGISMTPQRVWRSPTTGIRYPVAWRVSVPGEHLDLRLESVLDGQEWTGPLRYWEGAVRVVDAGSPARELGRGYLELTGYGGR